MILQLSPEVIIEILLFLSYQDIVSFLSTCKKFINMIKDPLLWTDLLKYRYNVIYNKTHKRIGSRRMFFEATISEPLRKSILVKHYNFKNFMPDYSYSYRYIENISHVLDQTHFGLLLYLIKNNCKELEEYFLELNGPNNYIISNLTMREKTKICDRVYSHYYDFEIMNNEQINKIMYLHKLDTKFILFNPSKLCRTLFLSCLYNVDKNALQYFINYNAFNSINIYESDFIDFFPRFENVEKIVDLLTYLYQMNDQQCCPIKIKLFTYLFIYSDIRILQAMSDSEVVKLESLDESLLIVLCKKYIDDRNIEKYNIVKKYLKFPITGVKLTINDFNLDSSDYTIALTREKNYTGVSLYNNIGKFYKGMINTLFELFNNSNKESIEFAKKLNLDSMDIITILAFNTEFKFCDNIIKNHYDLLTPNILNLVFPNCNKMVAASLLRFSGEKLNWKPPQNVINYCALNLANIAILQENKYYQDKITNDKMKKCNGRYDNYLLKRKWKFF